MSMIELIHGYTTMTMAAAAQLRRELGVADLLQAWQQRQVPQRGSLSDGSVYQFHGIGCVLERADDFYLDFEFGPGGRTDGFDAWRLWRFAKQFPTKYPDFQQRDQVEKALQALADEGVLCPSGTERDTLLYLRG